MAVKGQGEGEGGRRAGGGGGGGGPRKARASIGGGRSIGAGELVMRVGKQTDRQTCQNRHTDKPHGFRRQKLADAALRFALDLGATAPQATIHKMSQSKEGDRHWRQRERDKGGRSFEAANPKPSTINPKP